jgi:hypothetical protein
MNGRADDMKGHINDIRCGQTMTSFGEHIFPVWFSSPFFILINGHTHHTQSSLLKPSSFCCLF